MLVKVFIRRRIKKGMDREAYDLIKQIRLKAMLQEGYISGETLVNTRNPQEVLVVSTWQNMKSWENWINSQERTALDAPLEAMQSVPTNYDSYVFSKYKVYVEKGFPSPLD